MENNRELSAIRADIDLVDDEIVQLFLRRMRLADEVARTKAAMGGGVARPGREREILARVGNATGDFAPYATRLFQTLFALSREYQSSVITGNGDRS